MQISLLTQNYPGLYTIYHCVLPIVIFLNCVGMAVLNEAVDKLSTPAQQSYWIDVNVDIATSHIKITDIKV